MNNDDERDTAEEQANRALMHDENEVEATPEAMLEYLRQQIRNERISMGEIAELQSLAGSIEAGDVELLEWAGVPEEVAFNRDLLAAWVAENVTGTDATRKRVIELQEGDVILGDAGGRSRITGTVEPSAVMSGCHAVETEHGTLYLDADEMVAIARD